MKQKSEELLVISKRVFFLILLGIAFVGIVIGYTIGYVTTPVKEIYVSKTDESEKTVLSTTVGTAFANRQETPKIEVKQEQTKQSEEKSSGKTNTEITEKQQEKTSAQIDKNKQTTSSEQQVKTEQVKKFTKVAKYKTHKKAVYTIQLGAFSDMANVYELQKKLKDSGYDAFVVKEDLYKLRIGNFERFSHAKKLSQQLHSRGFENFIVKIKGGKP